MTTTNDIAVFEVEITASVEAGGTRHALILVALELLKAAYSTDDDTVSHLGPAVPSDVLCMNFSVGTDE